MKTIQQNVLPGLDWSKDGYASISGSLLERAQSIDAVICHWADDWNACQYQFPSMISIRSLTPIAYLKSFPHLATFATNGPRSITGLQELASGYAENERLAVPRRHLEPASQLLTPAACYHIYPRLAGEELESPRVFTMVCQCHRREDYYLPLQRQWCFNMREIVCLGAKNDVDTFTDRLHSRIDKLVTTLGLAAEWKVATDPFFDPARDPKAVAQKLDSVKKELCIGNGLAIASINNHRSFFGECYHITHNGKSVRSACVAFGIERWLYAFSQHFGPDASKWPIPEAVS